MCIGYLSAFRACAEKFKLVVEVFVTCGELDFLFQVVYRAGGVDGFDGATFCADQVVAVLARKKKGEIGGTFVESDVLLASDRQDGDFFGAGVAIWHVRLQNMPASEVPSCGPGFEYIMDNCALFDALSMIFQGSGECAEVVWRLLGLSMPSWVIIGLGGLLIAVFAAWKMSRESSVDELAMGERFFYPLWRFLVRYITPVAVIIVFFNAIGIL